MKCEDCGKKMVIMDKKSEPPQSYVCDCGRVEYI